MRIDFVHLVRVLRRSPASASAAILTLALTLGAGASIFAVVDAVLLTPPPFTNPDALVTVGEMPMDEPAAAPRAVSYATFEAWRDRAGSLATIEASDSMMNFGVDASSFPHVIFSLGTAPEYEP